MRKEKGIMRYMTPCCNAPIVAIVPEDALLIELEGRE
jgi:hypothetical protein